MVLDPRESTIPRRWAAVDIDWRPRSAARRDAHDGARKDERRSGQRAGVRTAMADKLKALTGRKPRASEAKRDPAQGKRYFATAELDRRDQP